MAYTERFDRALLAASRLHREQTRKGKPAPVPYVVHLLAVAALVGEVGGSEDQVIAALLHDAVEDQGGPDTLALIRREFGDAVADIVDGCSDTDEVPKPPWQERKERYLAHLAEASPSVLLVSCADKLHNARDLVADSANRATPYGSGSTPRGTRHCGITNHWCGSSENETRCRPACWTSWSAPYRWCGSSPKKIRTVTPQLPSPAETRVPAGPPLAAAVNAGT